MGVIKTHLGLAQGDLERCFLTLWIMRVRARATARGPWHAKVPCIYAKAYRFYQRSIWYGPKRARDGCVISYGLVTEKPKGAPCLGPGAI